MDRWDAREECTGAAGVLALADGALLFRNAPLAPSGHALLLCSVEERPGGSKALVLVYSARSTTCTACGTRHDADACPVCGHRSATVGAGGHDSRVPWTCAVCTLADNAGDECAACGSKPPAAAPCDVCGALLNAGALHCSKCGASCASSAAWSCYVCTLENSTQSHVCSACGAPALLAVDARTARASVAFVLADPVHACRRIAHSVPSVQSHTASARAETAGVTAIMRSRDETAASARDDISAAFAGLDALCGRADAMVARAQDMLGIVRGPGAETDLARMLLALGVDGPGGTDAVDAFAERLFTYRAGSGGFGATTVSELYCLYVRSSGVRAMEPAAFAQAVRSLDRSRWRLLKVGAFELLFPADVDIVGMLSADAASPIDAAGLARAARCPVALASAILAHAESAGRIVRDDSPATGTRRFFANAILDPSAL